MSIVKYHNTKTNRILVYESTPHYDPKTKQNRPTRKYLGYELPDTHEFVPSSGKRGRPALNKTVAKQPTESTGPDYETLYKKAAAEVIEKDQQFKKLQVDMKILHDENKALSRKLQNQERIIKTIHNLTENDFNG